MKKILLWFFSVGVGVFIVLLIIGFVVDDSDQYDLIETIELSPEQKKEVCQKLKSYLKKAHADMRKTSAHENEGSKKAESNASIMSKAYVKASDISKAYADMVKYKCLKGTPSCTKALKAMSKGFTDLSKYYANEITSKPHKITVVAGETTTVNLKEVFADFIKASAIISKAFANKEKYCK